jgi:hypothetical protein
MESPQEWASDKKTACSLKTALRGGFFIYGFGCACSNVRPLDRSPGVAEHKDVRERPNCIAGFTANSGSIEQQFTKYSDDVLALACFETNP